MTKNNEQIIIDGVDVSGCVLYMDKICIRTKSKCNAICDYASYELRRQLVVKEQECEELKKEKAEILEKTGMIETLQGYTIKDIEYMEQQLDQLKAELELEKTVNKNILKEHWEEKKRLADANASLRKGITIHKAKYQTLKQTLAEIKEIACDGYNNGQTSYATLQCEKIINIINEAQNDKN